MRDRISLGQIFLILIVLAAIEIPRIFPVILLDRAEHSAKGGVEC